MTSAVTTLAARLPELMLRDEQRLRRRLDGLRRVRDAAARRAATDQIAVEIEAAEARLAQRRARVPALRYPDELPVSQRRDDILA
ncbi:MAG TPA: hypothetical protein VES42_04615, partial [Pilimelia sp.]|nr:hypothetical protein [Pilimelia sp.]